jgi:hypothetical protein
LAAEARPLRRETLAAPDERLPHLRHLLGQELAHPAPEMVGLRPSQPSDLTRDAQDVLLEEQHPLGRTQDRASAGCRKATLSSRRYRRTKWPAIPRPPTLA